MKFLKTFPGTGFFVIVEADTHAEAFAEAVCGATPLEDLLTSQAQVVERCAPGTKMQSLVAYPNFFRLIEPDQPSS